MNQTQVLVKWKWGDWQTLLKMPTGRDAHLIHISFWGRTEAKRSLFPNRHVIVVKADAAVLSVCECL